MLGVYEAVAADLQAWGLPDDAQIYTADTSGAWWIWGAGQPLRGAAPWYYGDLTGYESADYVLLPICPSTPRAMRAIVADLEPHLDDLREVRRTELYVLFAKDG